MSYKLTIKKNAAEDWIVESDGGPRVIKVGEIVEWSLDAPSGTSAYLQFVDDIFEASGGLNEHWVGVIDKGRTLELTMASNALPDPRVPRRTYGYAVMVIDSGGFQYAIGSNPPPDLDVGN